MRIDSPIWDERAATFDEAADHGLTDPAVRRACEDLVRRHGREVDVRALHDEALWGKAVTDERYLAVSVR